MLLSFVDRKAVSKPAISSSAGTSHASVAIVGEHNYSNPCRSTTCEELCSNLTGTWYKSQHTSTMNMQKIHYRHLLALQQGPVEVPFCQIGNPTIWVFFWKITLYACVCVQYTCKMQNVIILTVCFRRTNLSYAGGIDDLFISQTVSMFHAFRHKISQALVDQM